MSPDEELELNMASFYKFKVITKTVSMRPDTEIKKVVHNLPKIEAYSGQLLNYADRYLVLLNHDFSISRLKSTWFFSPEEVLWTEVQQSGLSTENMIKSSAIFLNFADQIFACN